MGNSSVRWINILFVLAALSGVGVFLVAIGSLVKLVIISALLAYILDPLASFLESRWMGRTAATSVIFIGITGIGALFLFLAVPLLAREIGSLQDMVSSGRANAMITRFESFLQGKLSFLGIQDLDLVAKVHTRMSDTMNWLVSHVFDVVSLLTDLIIVPFIVFFLLKDGRAFKKHLINSLPNRHFEFALNLLYKMEVQLGNYLRGQFLDAIVVGILSTIALRILGIEYYFVFGALAGLANLVPYLGPVAGASLTIIVSLFKTGDIAMAPYIALAFILVKLIDDALIQPLIVAKSVDMHPLVVLLAVIIGGKFFGILGMLLSVPAAGFLKVAIQEGMANYRKYAGRISTQNTL
ncbi:MAG: AI-2E family transporter [Nitrospirae bacterium]|nr:AI-2E family transporter [Nitrospirota bacterium]